MATAGKSRATKKTATGKTVTKRATAKVGKKSAAKPSGKKAAGAKKKSVVAAKKAVKKASKAKRASARPVKKAATKAVKAAKKAVKSRSGSTASSKASTRAAAKVRRPAAKTGASRSPKKSSKAKETRVAKTSKKDFSSVRTILLERREHVLGNLGKLTGNNLEAGMKPVGDRVDDAVMDLELDSSYAIAAQEAEELRLIDTALEKTQDGTYGICEECEQKIEKPRLKALPYAVLCLKCKEAEELDQAGRKY